MKKSTNTKRKPCKINVLRAYEFENGNISFDMEIDGWITLYGLTMIYIEKEDRYFVSFASHQDKKDKNTYWNWYYFNVLPEEQADIEEQIEKILEENEKR